MFRGFSGYVQADAKSVYDILFREPDEPPDPDAPTDPSVRKELGCWSHCRRYFFEAAAVAKESVAREALLRIRRLFEMDAKWKALPPQKRKLMRDQFLRPELVLFFAFAKAELGKVQNQRGLLRSALVYATNQEEALSRFLEDGRLKMDNNASERALRRIAIGRKNWLFVGSDDHAVSTANLLSMIATAKLHDLDPRTTYETSSASCPTGPRAATSSSPRSAGQRPAHSWTPWNSTSSAGRSRSPSLERRSSVAQSRHHGARASHTSSVSVAVASPGSDAGFQAPSPAPSDGGPIEGGASAVDAALADAGLDAGSRRRPRAEVSRPQEASATLRVIVHPVGRVVIDGRDLGESPVEHALPAGRHVVEGVRGLERARRVVELEVGERVEVVLRP